MIGATKIGQIALADKPKKSCIAMTETTPEVKQKLAMLTAIQQPHKISVSLRPILSDKVGQIICPIIPVIVNTVLRPADFAKSNPTILYKKIFNYLLFFIKSILF